MKNLLLLFSIFCFYTCTDVYAMAKKPAKKPRVIVEEDVTIQIPSETRNNKTSFINVKSLKGFTQKEVDKLWRSLGKLNKTISGKCFKEFWLSKRLKETNGKTNEEVLNELLTKVANIDLISYYTNNSTVGYTYPNTSKVWINRKFHTNYSECKQGANLGHEGTHKIGYDHINTKFYSVSYSVNQGMAKCCE